MIVIEGMDNSGKSTLGEAMALYMGLKVQESEGPPLSDKEINDRVDRYESMEGHLFVRHPVISNAIYGLFRKGGNPITRDRTTIFYAKKPTLIYCDAGDRAFEGHVLKDHDTAVHQELLNNNQADLLECYRVWAAKKAHFIYRIGDDMEFLIDTVKFYERYYLA